MLKRILLLAFVCSAFICHSQLVIDSTFNWQQLIPTILGGGCVQISNVTFNSNQNASARFVCQNGFMNLTSGLLISTGKATNAIGPNNSTSKGTGLNRPGDTTLDAIVGGETYDAVILEFDFTSAEDDSVFIKYVFASEEYPEFVGSQYNDVFGFFVSGPGIAQHNIALIPGTTTPVAINNVNQNNFSQFFNDNEGGQECQYDGFTTPFTAFFLALANHTYHLKIAISDVGDGIYDSGVFLQSYPGVWDDVSGNITHQGQPATAGSVELWGFNIDSTQANLAATTAINADGTYSILNVVGGAYVLRSALDPIQYPNSYPKYYNNALLWEDADIIAVPCDSYTVDMQLMVLGTGSGQVGGSINYTSDQFKLISGGKPMAGVNVFLVNELTGNVHGYCQTDTAGKYIFKNINEGDYRIYVDIPGKHQATVREVAITKDNAVADGQDYFVADKIYVTDITPAEVELGLYPNPVAGSLNIKINLPESQKVTVDVFDVSGRIVESLYNAEVKKGVNLLQVPAGNLVAGLYYVRINIGNDKYMLKMVKASN